jgi:hypothetical protein
MVLGPKLRFHYYAHLDEIKTFVFKPLKRGTVVGTVAIQVMLKENLHIYIMRLLQHFHI